MIHRTPLTDAHWNDFKEAFVRYVIHGVIPGHFLQAVIANDLFDAVCRADYTSSGILTALVRLVHNEFPTPAHGSRKAIKEWGDVVHEDMRVHFEFNIQAAILTDYDHEAKG
jgi:hypothetical protein